MYDAPWTQARHDLFLAYSLNPLLTVVMALLSDRNPSITDFILRPSVTFAMSHHLSNFICFPLGFQWIGLDRAPDRCDDTRNQHRRCRFKGENISCEQEGKKELCFCIRSSGSFFVFFWELRGRSWGISESASYGGFR